MYVMVVTRSNIAHDVGSISRFMHNPDQSHWNVLKHVFIYLMDTKDCGILFGPNKNLGIVDYTDLDFANYLDSRKSITDYLFRFGIGAISWKSKL